MSALFPFTATCNSSRENGVKAICLSNSAGLLRSFLKSLRLLRRCRYMFQQQMVFYSVILLLIPRMVRSNGGTPVAMAITNQDEKTCHHTSRKQFSFFSENECVRLCSRLFRWSK